LLIRIDEIKGEGLTLEFEEPAQAFPILQEMVDRGECSFLEGVRVHLRAIRLHEMVEIEGRVATRARFACSRCLKGFDLPVEECFAVTYTRQIPVVQDESDEEGLELTAEDMGLVPFQGDEIDLVDEIQQQILMALPVRPLCSEFCKGLCPRCGADLNEGECGCGQEDFNIKFSALKDFKAKKK
jgi:uncharacterized protein